VHHLRVAPAVPDEVPLEVERGEVGRCRMTRRQHADRERPLRQHAAWRAVPPHPLGLAMSRSGSAPADMGSSIRPIMSPMRAATAAR
jgi:hypothetical protein